MIQSMTGYGKAETTIENGKLTVEIRSLNGKTADISVRTSLLPKEKEIEVRKLIASELVRGSIDFYMTYEQEAEGTTKSVDSEVVKSYYRQLSDVTYDMGLTLSKELMFTALLRFPDVISTPKTEIVNDDNWAKVEACIKAALNALKEFRIQEGITLYNDVTAKVEDILEKVSEVEKYEQERITAIRARINSKISELAVEPDQNRLEAEMIYYLERLDINEEKTRLRQHCRYFMDAIDSEPYPGKKLGFIAQEIGREINTTGSKANHTEMQKVVVMMKDDLEKIKEQVLNIL